MRIPIPKECASKNDMQDYENDKPGTLSHTDIGRPTKDSPDTENGGDVPNDSLQWSGKAFDRFEGSVKGKNRTQDLDNDVSVNQNVGKPMFDRK